MRLKPHALLFSLTAVFVAGCTASRSAGYAPGASESYSPAPHPPESYHAPQEPLTVPPVPPAIGVSRVKSVGWSRLFLPHRTTTPCVTEPTVCHEGCGCAEDRCDRKGCAEKIAICSPDAICRTPGPVQTHPIPLCVQKHGCCDDSYCGDACCGDLCTPEGCCEQPRCRGLLTGLYHKLFSHRKHAASCGEVCLNEGCSDGCCEAVPLIPSRRVEHPRPVHNGCPLAGPMDDPFVPDADRAAEHDDAVKQAVPMTTPQPAEPNRPQPPQVPEAKTPVPPTPVPGTGRPESIPDAPQPEQLENAKPLTPVPTTSDAGPWIEPQIWPRLKAYDVQATPRKSTTAASWSLRR